MLSLLLFLATPPDVDFDKLLASVKAKHDECFVDNGVKMKPWKEFVVETLSKNDLSGLTAKQLLTLNDLNLLSDLPGEEDDAELAKLATMITKRTESDQADVLLKLVVLADRASKPEDQVELGRLFGLTTTQSGLDALSKQELTLTLVNVAAMSLSTKLRTDNVEGVKRLYDAFSAPWPTELATFGESVWKRLFSEAAVGKEHHEAARVAAVDCIERLLKKENPPGLAGFLKGEKDRMTGSAAKGELIGKPAKGLTMLWASDPKITKIEDLKGRVVILDFWATWCGPCIASTPHLKDLVKTFEKSPVTLLGVTSVQGQVFGLEDKPIDVKGAPAKEFELMKRYMAKNELNWPIVFTKEDVFNPDFGISGIPFTAIIAPDGTVRYANLHPSNDHEKIMALVSDLLKEFHLASPG